VVKVPVVTPLREIRENNCGCHPDKRLGLIPKGKLKTQNSEDIMTVEIYR